MATKPPDEGTHCEWCGAAFEPGQQTTKLAPVKVDESGTEPETETHCEWCGAAYPVPDKDG